jgi:hypothetical protein
MNASIAITPGALLLELRTRIMTENRNMTGTWECKTGNVANSWSSHHRAGNSLLKSMGLDFHDRKHDTHRISTLRAIIIDGNHVNENAFRENEEFESSVDVKNYESIQNSFVISKMRCPASIEFEVMWTTASANPLNR